MIQIEIIYIPQTFRHFANIETVSDTIMFGIWLAKVFLNCIFNFSPCNYSWICDGIKRDLLSSSSTYVDTMKRVKGEKFQHNFLASLWVFIFFLSHKQIKHSQYSSQTIACATLDLLCLTHAVIPVTCHGTFAS